MLCSHTLNWPSSREEEPESAEDQTGTIAESAEDQTEDQTEAITKSAEDQTETATGDSSSM